MYFTKLYIIFAPKLTNYFILILYAMTTQIKHHRADAMRLHNLVPVAKTSVCDTDSNTTLNPVVADSDPNAGIYRPLGDARPVTDSGYDLLCRWRNTHAIASDEGSIVTIDVDTGRVLQVDSVSARCAAAISGGRLVAMADQGPLIYDADTDGNITPDDGAGPEWPPISITAEPMAPVAMNIDAIELDKVYSPGDTMPSYDVTYVRKLLALSYRNAVNRATNMGVFVQPLLARAVVRDSAGAVIYRGPELLVMPPGGLPLDTSITLDIDTDGMTTLPATLTIPTYRLRVSCPMLPASPRVDPRASLHIEISPQFHPWLPILNCGGDTVAVGRGPNGQPRFVAQMPFAHYGLSIHDDERNADLIDLAIRKLNVEPFEAACFQLPFDHGIDALVEAYSLPDIEQEVMRAVYNPDLRNRLKEPSPFCMNAPHTFTAAQCTASGKAVLYGDLTALLWHGYSPADYAVQSVDDGHASWLARVRVRFADGSEAVRYTSGRGARPRTLNPLIAYPHRDAEWMEIVVRNTTGDPDPIVWTTYLTPDRSGTRAINLAEGLKPRVGVRNPDAVFDYSMPPARPKVQMPDRVAIADTASPFCITAVAEVGARVTALMPAMSTAGAWDFGRTRFVVFTADNVTLLNASPKLMSLATGTLAKDGAQHRRAVTSTDTASIYYIGTNNRIYHINGTKVSTFARLEHRADCLGYDASDNSLQAVDTSAHSPVQHLALADGQCFMTSTAGGPTASILSVAGRLLTGNHVGVWDMSISHRLPPRQPVKVSLTAKADAASYTRFIAAVTWQCCATLFSGQLDVSRNYLDGPRARCAGYNVHGRLAAPLVMDMVGRPLTSAILTVDATVDPEALIALPLFTSKPLSQWKTRI